MTQRPAMDSLFSDDPFFSQERLPWPLHHEALSSLQQDFFHRRTKLAEGLLKELRDGPHLLDLHAGAFPRALFPSLSDSVERQRDTRALEPCPKESQEGPAEDLLVTLDVRGYAPEDIHVKLEGRRLEVVAMKRTAAEASHSSSSPSSSSRQHSEASSQAGFVQSIDLPPHLDLSALTCSLTEDGRLRIDAPVAKQPITNGEEQQVPLRFRTSLEFPITKDAEEDSSTD